MYSLGTVHRLATAEIYLGLLAPDPGAFACAISRASAEGSSDFEAAIFLFRR
jgi:hypothetical protein